MSEIIQEMQLKHNINNSFLSLLEGGNNPTIIPWPFRMAFTQHHQLFNSVNQNKRSVSPFSYKPETNSEQEGESTSNPLFLSNLSEFSTVSTDSSTSVNDVMMSSQ